MSATTRRVVDLLDLVPDPVSEAVERVVRRADWWAGA